MINLFGQIFGILGAMSGILLIKDWYNKKFRDRSFYQIYRIAKNRKVVIVCPTQSGTDASPNILTTHEDSMALAAIQNQFVEHGLSHDVRLHSDMRDEDRSEYLFLICGPAGNSLTRSFLCHPSVGIPYRFSRTTDNWAIYDKDGQQAHAPPIPGQLDFAIIAKLSNPWSSPENITCVYLAAGIEGLGTWGAAYHLAKRVDDLERRLRAEKAGSSLVSFAGIIKSQSNGLYPPITTIVELKVL
jgi:hypothetical protein